MNPSRAVALLACLAATASLVAPPAAAQSRQRGDADLVGSWSWSPPRTDCVETYTYRADGTLSVQSGDERTDAVYRVEAVRGSRFRKLTMRTTRDNRGKDCAGAAEDDAGRSSTTYYLMSPDKVQMILCNEPKLERCLGPFTRIVRT